MIGERDGDCEEMAGGAAGDSNARRVDWLVLEQQEVLLVRPADSPKIRQRSRRHVEEQQQRCQRGIGHASTSLYFFFDGVVVMAVHNSSWCVVLLHVLLY